MRIHALRRLLQLVPVLFGISLVVFLIMSLLPGDPALAILGPYATPESLAALRRDLGLDRPLWERFFIWLGNILRGNFGRSVTLEKPVIDELRQRIGPTLLLSTTALALSVVLGLAVGVTAAVRRSTWRDHVLTLAVLIGISTPQFWLALLLILVFAVHWQWLPVSGMTAVYGGGDFSDLLRHLILPATSLAIVVTGVFARLSRAAMLEELSQDHVRMARALGLREGRIIYTHAFLNMLGKMMPVIGLQVGFLLGGAVYIETVFQWPGLGRMLVDAILSRDLLLVQGGVLVMAAAYMLVNLIADLLQQALDPRIAAR